MNGILVAGTSSDAGKSLVVTGICRALQRRGLKVAPYKAQNMSNNSMVTADGAEIGRAQFLQAQAAKIIPTSAMNPVLLKPGNDKESFIVLRGQPYGSLPSGEYATGRKILATTAWQAYAELTNEYDLIICEGAGSPAEINLRSGDYVNMGLAQEFNLPVVLVGDIDRGGTLAAIYGTWALLPEDDRKLLKGYLINKFRGDRNILAPGLDEISNRTGLKNFGILDWIPDVWLDGEDSLAIGQWRSTKSNFNENNLNIAVVRFPRISNATDIDALASEPGINVQVTTDPNVVNGADLVVLPGSRTTVPDLVWLHERGIAKVILERAAHGRPILGICGGYQMLSQEIEDNLESANGRTPGLGLLPIKVSFGSNKILGRPQGSWRGIPVSGYEIHHGICTPTTNTNSGESFLAGWHQGAVWGTLWHGSLECDAFRRAWLSEIAAATGRNWHPRSDVLGFSERREYMINRLADVMETQVKLDELLALAL